MYTLSKAVVLAMLALSASALTTPRHGAAHYGRHHAIARNVPADETSAPAAIPREIRRRSTSRRCKPRTSSSFVPSSTILIADPTPSSEAPEPTTSSKAAEPTTSSKAPEPTTSSKTPEPTTSSKAAEPTTSSKAPEPTTSSKAPEPTTSSKAAPTTKEPETTQAPTTTKVTTTAQATTTASSGDGPSYLFGTQSGQGTFYATGLGACGITNNDSQYIAAVSKLLFDSYPNYTGANPNNNPVCNKQIKASRNGKSVTVTVTDRCEACAITDLDFSPAAFDQLGDEAEGRIPITWTWV